MRGRFSEIKFWKNISEKKLEKRFPFILKYHANFLEEKAKAAYLNYKEDPQIEKINFGKEIKIEKIVPQLFKEVAIRKAWAGFTGSGESKHRFFIVTPEKLFEIPLASYGVFSMVGEKQEEGQVIGHFIKKHKIKDFLAIIETFEYSSGSDKESWSKIHFPKEIFNSI